MLLKAAFRVGVDLVIPPRSVRFFLCEFHVHDGNCASFYARARIILDSDILLARFITPLLVLARVLTVV